jgi:hypothetical protein
MESGRVRATVKRSRNVNTFAELSWANWVLLENTEQQREGWFYECLTTIVMAAFKFEAYLNHVGAAVFPSYWKELERLSHIQKRNIICAHLRIVKADGERPWQTLNDLFKFRNWVAHGRSEILDPPEALERGELEQLRRNKPLAAWEKLCTTEFARRAYEDTEAIMRLIHSAAGLDEADLRRSGDSYTIRDVKRLDSDE